MTCNNNIIIHHLSTQLRVKQNHDLIEFLRDQVSLIYFFIRYCNICNFVKCLLRLRYTYYDYCYNIILTPTW